MISYVNLISIGKNIQFRYHDLNTKSLLFNLAMLESPQIKELAQYNRADQKTGVWKHYDGIGRLYKTENFIIPQKEEEMIDLTQIMH